MRTINSLTLHRLWAEITNDSEVLTSGVAVIIVNIEVVFYVVLYLLGGCNTFQFVSSICTIVLKVLLQF